MRKKNKSILFVCVALAVLGVILTAVLYLRRVNIPVLEPRGIIATKERQLIIIAALLSLIVVLPLFTLLGIFAWRYREGNTKARYSPNLQTSAIAETIWWLVPSVIILVLSVITWRSSHELDPYKAIASANKPITVQVVALDWKWLFIYPRQHVASVNFVQFPVNTPVDFEITADAPMNSFWVPQLGGQIYAMPGMSTELHLMASKTGDYHGSSANISGVGFAGMTFVARASTTANFNTWLQKAAASQSKLTAAAYAKLAKPSQNNSVATYASVQNNLYDTIVMNYMMPPSTAQNTNSDQQATAMQGMATQ